MHRFSILPLAVLMVALLSVGCSSVKPAGSLGYMVNGDPLMDPVPTNYRHVPPVNENVGPWRLQTKF